MISCSFGQSLIAPLRCNHTHALVALFVVSHSQVSTPAMEKLIDDFFNPAQTQTQLQPDCDLNDGATTHCSLLFADGSHAQGDEVWLIALMVLCQGSLPPSLAATNSAISPI